MSGIYIPDLSMPKNCYDCPFGADVDIGVGIAHGCNLIKDFAQFADERHTDCPLVPVPEHGRLVDADALKAKQQEDADIFQNAYTLMEKSRRDEALNAVANIANAPTIIPADKEGEG